jgi:DNA-binding response OmpR family regulator
VKAKILLLEDDLTLNETIAEFLRENDFDVTPVYDGEEASDAIYEQTFDLFLLDVNVPLINGFNLLKQKRDEGVTTPAIYITSLNSIDSLEDGYNSGCDDYVRKPFALKELLFRVETILKRDFYHESKSRIAIAPSVEYDASTNTLYSNDERTRLSSKEALLLKLFLRRQNQIVSHEVIYEALWRYDETPSESSLRTYIKNLRKLLGKEKILSVKREGYVFSAK